MKKIFLLILLICFSSTAYSGQLGWIRHDRTSTLSVVNWDNYNLVELTADGIKVKIVNSPEWYLTADRSCELLVTSMNERIQLFDLLSKRSDVNVFCFVSDYSYREIYVKTSNFKITSFSPKK